MTEDDTHSRTSRSDALIAMLASALVVVVTLYFANPDFAALVDGFSARVRDLLSS